MFIRAFAVLFSVVALAGVATAVPATLEARNEGDVCNYGSVQCCSSVQSSDSTVIDSLFGYLGIQLPPSGTQIGVTCSPITVGGGSGSGATCTQQTVCCTGNTFNGNIVTGCSPITINA